MIHFFESNPYYHVESNGSSLLVFSKERLAGVKEIKALYDFGKRLGDVVNQAASSKGLEFRSSSFLNYP